MAQINIPSSGLWGTIATALDNMFSEIFGSTGWGDYVDTQYSEGSPLSITGNTNVDLPNNKGSVIESQKPSDVSTFYDGTVITGRSGDGLLVTVDFKAKPTNQATTEIKVWIDITGGTGTPAGLANLYPRLITFDKGVGVEKPINFTVGGYTLATWEANGGKVRVRANGSCDIYDVRYVLTRTHKAR